MGVGPTHDTTWYAGRALSSASARRVASSSGSTGTGSRDSRSTWASLRPSDWANSDPGSTGRWPTPVDGSTRSGALIAPARWWLHAMVALRPCSSAIRRASRHRAVPSPALRAFLATWTYTSSIRFRLSRVGMANSTAARTSAGESGASGRPNLPATASAGASPGRANSMPLMLVTSLE